MTLHYRIEKSDKRASQKGEYRMPIFEYRCTQCGCGFEKLVWSSQEKDAPECPKCKSKEVERVLSCFSKGGGGGASLSSSCSPRSSGFS